MRALCIEDCKVRDRLDAARPEVKHRGYVPWSESDVDRARCSLRRVVAVENALDGDNRIVAVLCGVEQERAY